MILAIAVIFFLALGLLGAGITDYIYMKRYGCPSLSVLSAKCYRSKHFKWLVLNIWGNDDWYLEQVVEKMQRSKYGMVIS